MFLTFFFSFSISELLKDRIVNVSMEGLWKDTSLLAEAASFIADANGEAYWTFLRGLEKLSKLPNTIEEIRSYSLDFLSEELKALLELSLLTRAYSPRIEMFRQIASNFTKNPNQCFSIYSNSIFTSTTELKNSILNYKKSRPSVYAFEPRKGHQRDTVVFYCPVYDKSIFEWFNFLESNEEFISFVYRPIGIQKNEYVKLRGYGFEMRPFNYSMTYSNQTENNLIKGIETEDTPLMKLKNIIYGSNLPNSTQLATQLIQFIKMTDNPFKALLEVTENFPLYANNISKIPVAQSLTEKIFDKPERLISGASAIYVNGRLIRTPDVYHILQASLDELRISQILREHFGLSKESLTKSIHLQPEKAPPRKFVVDYRSSFMYSLNDLETGKAYQNWTTSLTSLLTKSPARIKRNIFNAVFLIDPLNPSDMKLLLSLEEQVKGSVPIRFSYFVSPRNNTRYAKRVYYSWAHIRLRYGADKAHQFLLATAKLPTKEEKLKETHFRTAYQDFAKTKSSPKWQELDDLFEPKSRESKHLKRMRNFQEHLGFKGQGLLFNGRWYPGKRQDKNLQTIMIKALPRLRIKMVDHRFLNSSIDTLDTIFDGDDVFTRYNPLIQHIDKSPSEFIPLTTQSYYFQREFMNWARTLRYNSTSTNVKFASFWVFIGEELSGTMEAKHISIEVESFIKTMPTNCRIAFFSEGGRNNLAMNSVPPPMIQDLLQLKPDEVTIILNGRVIRMKGRVIYDWLSEDFNILLKWELHRSISMVQTFFQEDVAFNYEALRDDVDQIDSSFHSQLALYLSFVYGYGAHNGIYRFPVDISVFNDNSPVVMNYNNPDSNLRYSVMLNPFELPFQAIAPIVDFLRDSSAFDVKFYVNFPKEHQYYPDNLRAYHRFLLHDDVIQFDRFDSKTVYSLMPHQPEKWMVEPVSAPFDLDNFKPFLINPGTISASYRLSSILVEGSALDEQYIPVHGLRINLDMGEKGNHDSLSIKTMGYFQLKSLPGIWNIELGEGASQIVYNISSTTTLTVSSFVPSWVTMLVQHNEGMTRFSVYDLPKELRPITQEEDIIHVFAVVSGELYERLVKIMMISVMKNTNSSVHFWFLKNFISAQFMNDLKIFSKKYGFKFDFVEYHWPSWVTRQNERQRIIWGNKILFFDALFPMNVTRIIYIDADAVVRGDLTKLMKADLKGRPYGFVPFCTSRKEMSQYHFWKKGYWKKHLGKNKYHISAMFVVDLDRFRRMGAGDKLRKHYEKIVGNKQSLANLDQDLPNDAQDQVPIFSLPKRWLWCCTWCSENDKDNAMIIDLANNPKTKISKVEMAKQFIEEWPLLDDEASKFFDMNYFINYNLTEIRLNHKNLLIKNQKENDLKDNEIEEKEL